VAFDDVLADRLRDQLSGRGVAFTEKRMFGGLSFLVGGHMALGVLRDDVVVRVGKAGHANAMAQPGARAMDFTGRSMASMVYVGPEGTDGADDLGAWVDRGVGFVETLPPK
jgi:TfoX/Sxy family transcriptional regulator of competence genes